MTIHADLVTRLRQRIDQLTDERDQARAQVEQQRRRANKHIERVSRAKRQAALWKHRCLQKKR